MKKNKKLLIFLDIDGTLIKPDQKPNSKKLPNIIKKESKNGTLFGLNSNRSFHDIENIYKNFSLNGPIILENGVYYKKNLDSKKNFLIKNPLKLKNISKKAIKEFIKSNKSKNCTFLFGDTVKFIKLKKLKSKPLVIMANGFRDYTGSIHIYKYGRSDFDTAKKMNTFLKKYFKKETINLAVEVPKSFGNVVYWPQKINKGIALKKIKKHYKDYDLAMIGDDLADLETLKEVKYFFAVGNAQKKVKEKALLVAKQEYTKGVIEIIKHLVKIKKC